MSARSRHQLSESAASVREYWSLFHVTSRDGPRSAPNHAEGHLWTSHGPLEVPFSQLMPYNLGGAGAMNSTIEDLAALVRLHLGDGEFEGRRIVSAENLSVTRIPRVGLTDKVAYAMGWFLQTTPNGQIVWHSGGTMGFGAYIGMARDRDIGVIVLTNTNNTGLRDVIGEWVLDRLMENPQIDHAAARLASHQAMEATRSTLFAKPTKPRPGSASCAVCRHLRESDLRQHGGRRNRRRAHGHLCGDRVETEICLLGRIFVVSLVPEGPMAGPGRQSRP
jgi:CubicO group peptidase (beta-lactamase class C family)